MTLLLAWHPVVVSLATLVFLAVCLLMVLTVLIQKPQGGGLSGAFGSGAGSGQTAFGTKTGDALTIFTIIVFVVWMILAVVLNFASRPAALGTLPPVVQPSEGGQPDGEPGAGTNTTGGQPVGAAPGTVEPAPALPAPNPAPTTPEIQPPPPPSQPDSGPGR